MKRIANMNRGLLTGAMVLMLGLGLGGCADQGLQTQNSQLIKQNQQLAHQLADTKADLAQTRQQLQQQQQIAANASQQAVAHPGNTGTQSGYNSVLPAFNNTPPVPEPSGKTVHHHATSHRSSGVSGEIHRFVLSSDVLFASGSARLHVSSEHALLQVEHALRTRYAGRQIRIEGYTDNRPIHHVYHSNYALGLARARAVEAFLARHGISRSRMTAVSYGDHRLVSRTNLAQDRRVEIVVLR